MDLAEEIRVFDGKFVQALDRRCKELLPHFEKILARLKDAKHRAREDVWMLGVLRELEEEISRAQLETRMYCHVVEALKERVVK